MKSADSFVEPEVTFLMVGRRCSRSPGFILSGRIAYEELFFGYLVFWFFGCIRLGLRRIAGFEGASQAALAFQDGDAVFFGAAGVDG